MLEKLFPGGESQFGLIPTLVNFAICMIMSFVIREFYTRRSFSLTGKNHIGSILPILSGVVFMVIIVIKSSLALSLGLVGALSIVRFRTPIKEPEELAYLFLAIALGLGYGSGNTLITTIITVFILFIIYFWLSNRKIGQASEYNMVVSWHSPEIRFESLLENIEKRVSSLRVVRLDYGDRANTAVLLVEPDPKQKLDDLFDSLKAQAEEITCSFFEAKTNW
ncbi:MAG: DUF4956 domain-containing protein [Proteobacteria bacterium]|nr:DUF4956 domain-containing protein [Pseudomonadota bacterium]